MKSTLLSAIFVALVIAFPLPLSASLGGDVTSVHSDQAKMEGVLRTTANDTFTVHEIQAPTGAGMKEYVSPAGKVFAVSWHGAFPPDLRQLLGVYFDQYTQAVQAQRSARRGHGPLLIQQPGLVIQVGGHLRSFSGKAYVPQLLPAGVSAKDLQ
ncbi:MAG: DUF2844 domain-containing protein [Candidatus Acidiferrales bacterium]